MTSVFLHSEIGDASMTCYGVLAGEGETGNFHRVGNSPSAWRVWDFSVLFVSYVHVLVPYQGIPRWCRVKSPPANAEDLRDSGSIPGLGRSPGVGNDSQLHYSCLENSMGRGAWWATVYRVTENWTLLTWPSSSSSSSRAHLGSSKLQVHCGLYQITIFQRTRSAHHF